jgi:hypothetical protein
MVIHNLPIVSESVRKGSFSSMYDKIGYFFKVDGGGGGGGGVFVFFFFFFFFFIYFFLIKI